jgi:methionine sulfoxide reductase heme-binding subunit
MAAGRPFTWATHIGSLLPLAWLIFDFATDRLSSNPIQDITFRTGKPALVLLVLSLAVTPAQTMFGWRWVHPLRRRFGLYCFLYVCVHFLVFIGLDYGFDTVLLKEAILEKPYALVGFSAFLLLVPLAVTSTKGWMRRLGRKWRSLHRLVYVVALLAVVHYTWLVKSDVREPLAWGLGVVVLLGMRMPRVRRAISAARQRRAADADTAAARRSARDTG